MNSTYASKALRRSVEPIALAVVLYLSLTGVALLGVRIMDLDIGIEPARSVANAMSWPGVWARWDSGHYVTIAQNGYRADNFSSAFYPLYPLLIHAGDAVSGMGGIAIGSLLSVVFAALAFIVLYQIVALDYGASVGRMTVALIALFPTAFYFYAVYTESLFLLLSVLAYASARTKRWKWAILVCFVAGFARYNGFLISVLVAIEYLIQNRSTSSNWLKASLFLVPGVAGFLLYQVYLWALFSDMLLSFKIQREFGKRYVTWPWISVWDTLLLAIAGKGVEGNWFWRLVGWQELLYTGAFSLLSLASWKTVRPSLATYLSLSVVMFVTSHGPDGMGLLSMPRYMLPLFPAYIVFALWLEKRTWRWAVPAISAVFLILYTVWFASGRWVA